MDLKSHSRWYEYSRARDEIFAATDTELAPWYVADSNKKKRALLNIISHLLEQVPYQSPARERLVLPAREKPHGYREREHGHRCISAKY
jgi:polyphosphate kinase